MIYTKPPVSIAILDYNRPIESKILFQSLEKYAKFDHEVVYLSNGGNQQHALDLYNQGFIDKLILNKENNGCGLGMRQLFQSCESDYVMLIQVDQFLGAEITNDFIREVIVYLEQNPKYLYCDLAGNQSHGTYSERGHLINRHKYLSIPNINNTIGGPGPYSEYQWTENLVQQYMKKENLSFISYHLFADNGVYSVRDMNEGGAWVHRTDTKKLWNLRKPLKLNPSYPKFSENEQKLAFDWPDGKIPENEIAHSFTCWNGNDDEYIKMLRSSS